MNDLEEIAAAIRRQRQIIDEALDSTSSRCGHAAELLEKIEDLRKRAEKTRLLFQASQRADAEPPP